MTDYDSFHEKTLYEKFKYEEPHDETTTIFISPLVRTIDTERRFCSGRRYACRIIRHFAFHVLPSFICTGFGLVHVTFRPTARDWPSISRRSCRSSLLGLVHVNVTLQALAEFGAIFLMFAVGLENRLRDLLAVGKEAIIVAILGITLPMLGGYAFGYFHDLSQIQSIFIGTTMVATSVGITAQVLNDLGVINSKYARIILGAASD